MGVSFETYLRRPGDVLVRRRHYVRLRRGHDIPIRCREDVPQRHLWVFHLRRTCDVAETYKETSLRRRHDVLLPGGTLDIYGQKEKIVNYDSTRGT